MAVTLSAPELVPSTEVEVHAPREGEARLREIVDMYYPFLWRSLRRLGVDEASVDDAAQAVLLVVARRLDDIAYGAERSFVFQTAARVASDHRRARARAPRAEPLDAVLETASDGLRPDDLVDQRRRRALLDELLDELDEEHRTVFVLFELEELTVTQIAEVLGVPRGTAASRLRRAHELFENAARRVQARRARTGGAR